MPSIDRLEHPRCRHCGKALVTFYWGTMATACCSNTRCQAYKQPQNIERGEKNGEKGKRKEDSPKEVQEKLRLSQKRH
jgi:hypothetical protein